MNVTRFKITLADPELQKIRLAAQNTHNIVMAAPVTNSGGNAYISVDTTEGWRNRTTYIPRKGEIIVYSDRNVIDDVEYPGMKIGDGSAYAVDLPFVNDDTTGQLYGLIQSHIQNDEIHVTELEKEFWNNKLNIESSGENLIFNRH